VKERLVICNEEDTVRESKIRAARPNGTKKTMKERICERDEF